jgi:hypothetical protein
MKVPNAKKWQKETGELRQIVLDCDLQEELKWGKPCFTFQSKNVAIVIPLKASCAFSFFRGTLLKDPKKILQRIGKAQAGRWVKFTSAKEISALSTTLKSYIQEAVEIEKSGRKVLLICAKTSGSPKVSFLRLCPSSSLFKMPRLCVTSLMPALPPHTWKTILILTAWPFVNPRHRRRVICLRYRTRDRMLFTACHWARHRTRRQCAGCARRRVRPSAS